jgi:hypothetical protein
MTSEEEIKVKEQELIEKRNLFKARLVIRIQKVD